MRIRTVALAGLLALLAACDSTAPRVADAAPACQERDPASDPAAALAAAGMIPVPPKTPAELRLSLAPQDIDVLYTRDPQSDDRLPGTARIDGGEEQELRGLRFRGNSTRFLPKKSFNIRFEDRQPLLFDSARMNANAMFTDPAMMRERLMWDMFRHLGQPASRTRYVDLYLNDIFEGLYLHIERVDEDLLANAGLNPNGTLVRDNFRDVRLEDPRINRNSAFGFALSAFSVEEAEALLASSFRSRGEPNWGALADLIRWVEGARAGSAFARELPQRIDIDNFIDWLAVHYLTGDFDSFGDDYWLYLDHEDEDAVWKFIPWDNDLSFGSHWRPGFGIANDYFAYERPVQSEWQNRLIRYFLGTPSLRKQLDCRMTQLMDEVYTVEYFNDAIDQIDAETRASVTRLPVSGEAFERHPTNHHALQAVRNPHIDMLRDFVELRYAFLGRQIDVGEETTPDSSDTLNEASVDLSGREAGDVLLLTDAGGWTIARLELLSVPQQPGSLAVRVTEDAAIDGVDRTWTIENGGSAFDAELSLYYRNDIPGVIADRSDNWVTASNLAVGEQWSLSIAERTGNSFAPLPDSRINPYSSRANASLNLPTGITQFVIATQQNN